MNIANIIALTKQLESLDFRNISYVLMKKMSFKLDNFSILLKVEKGKDLVYFNLFFEKEHEENIYSLRYYDAVLQKLAGPIGVTINGINTADLERSMKEIDWNTAFNFNTHKNIVLEDKTTWEKEQKVEAIIESLSELENSEEGKLIAMEFKLKYWTGLPFQDVFGNMTPLKSKLEVSQRFYFTDGQTGISVDEAYRFLQNRWLEKHLYSKRKLEGGVEDIRQESGVENSSNMDQPKKKHFSKNKKNNG